ncbi:hypothetical protein Scep_007175 [Stephania cephalantha]|uniref:Uncharacterized protein n=1 Tax=Stephania cephalantha TaxID=152367 RepID=A0AAP0PKU3_9MAGN
MLDSVEDIPEDEHDGSYESPHVSDPDVDFDEHGYLDNSFLYPHEDGRDDEVQKEPPPTFTAPPAPRPL